MRAKLLKRKYIKDWGISYGEAMMEYGRYISIY
jgi:hypothetical protein